MPSTTHTMTATCRTPGCGNADAAIEIEWSDQGEDLPAPSVTCGVCGQQITDITHHPDPEGNTDD